MKGSYSRNPFKAPLVQSLFAFPRTNKIWLISLWVIFGFLLITRIWLFLLGLPIYYQRLQEVCTSANCLYESLTPTGLQQLQSLGWTEQRYAGYMTWLLVFPYLVSTAVGLFVAWVRKREWVALFVVLVLTPSTIRYLTIPNLPLFLLALQNFYGNFLDGTLFLLFFLIFPDGRFVPRISGWIFLIVTLFALTTLLTGKFGDLSDAAWLITILSAIGCLVYRYFWGSDPVQRQQIKWLLFSLLVLVFLSLSLFITIPRQELIAGSLPFLFDRTINGMISLILPIGVAVAILRYRLWDIDLIVRRTLIYAILTALLALLYFGSVITLQGILGRLAAGPMQSQPAIVVSTLLVAALFGPLRRRVQERIDRRFYRKRYDAERVIENFGASLRDEVDIEQLSLHLKKVIHEAIQPESVSVWLRSTRPRPTGQ